MKNYLSLLLTFIVSIPCFTQVEFESKDGLISSAAYNTKIAKDFNYLILGDNSPQQGISATLNEKKSNIKINGLFYSGPTGVFTIEADLAASNGIYFFDQENGSEQGKITLNYYRRLTSLSKYKSLNPKNRAYINLQIVDLLAKTKTKYDNLLALLKTVKFNDAVRVSSDEEKRIYKQLRSITRNYINEDDKKGYDELPTTKFVSANYVKSTMANDNGGNQKGKDGIKDIKIDNKNNFDLIKLIKDYDETRDFILTKLEDSINKIELQNTSKQWTYNHTLFYGVSPFYERQSFKRFTYNANQSFSDMFNQVKGDIYGVTLSLNYSIEKGLANKKKLSPHSLFTRLSLSLIRGSNISNFRNSTLETSGVFGNDVNGNPVIFTNSDNAFIGDTRYEYGFGQRFTLDTYFYPLDLPIGLFGIISYEKIDFSSRSSAKDKEMYPLRLGLLFSLVNKDSKKPNITIQTFLDRTDLNLSPNGKDKDLRFGLGIGLPINF
ncbi:hypothetical protein [Winogradskyella aquimaris]|uniref:Uncharacterized protein n=1 Tax=Winogradskyella aquimaris TaxID=864074 RepID=A0ABU5EKI6_9FLAO|nr:hypothetical protein [Winogradskyella aquimaris]MDY2586783.1 hypothetical protein [Winogradskyella aquimaris]